jgi:hypothetical protein
MLIVERNDAAPVGAQPRINFLDSDSDIHFLPLVAAVLCGGFDL